MVWLRTKTFDEFFPPFMSARSCSLQHVVAIRHVDFEDLGTFDAVIRTRGAEIGYVEAALDDLSVIDADGLDLLVVLGGPIGVYEEKSYPWLTGLKQMLPAPILRLRGSASLRRLRPAGPALSV
ncbi:hypothetical protein P3T43_007017 [Paraburkholderia sp. GAS41]|jgi:hypothetical protein